MDTCDIIMNEKLKEELSREGPNSSKWDDRRCGFLKKDGSYCLCFRRYLADGTRTDRCRYHGGGSSTTIAKSLSHMESGTTTYILRREVAARFRAFNNLTDKLDLTEELDIFRAYLSAGIEKWQEGGELTWDEISWVMQKIGDLSRLVEAIARIRNTTALTIAEVQYVQAYVASIMKKYIPEDRLPQALNDLYAATQTEPTHLKDYYDTIEDGEVVHHPESTLNPRARYILKVVGDNSDDS